MTFLVLGETGSYWEPVKPSREGVHVFTSGSCVLVLSSTGLGAKWDIGQKQVLRWRPVVCVLVWRVE